MNTNEYMDSRNELFRTAVEVLKTIPNEDEKKKVWVKHLIWAGGSWYLPNNECSVCYEVL